MNWIEMLVSSFYGLSMFGTFLHGNFSRQLTISRARTDPNETEKAVNHALWDVRSTFVELFNDEQAKKNALNLFPSMRDLPENVDEAKPMHTVTRTKIAIDSVLWPVMVPVNITRKAAQNIAANELANLKSQQDSYNILADHEEFPALAAAFRSGDDLAIQQAIEARADWQERMDELERHAPMLDLSDKTHAKDDIDAGKHPVFDPDTGKYLGSVEVDKPKVLTK